jgi:hypothetical protein
MYLALLCRLVSFISLWYVVEMGLSSCHLAVDMQSFRFFVGFVISGLRVSRISENEYPINPMKVSVTPKVLALLVLVSLVGSTVSPVDSAIPFTSSRTHLSIV